jgi:hypothetical protein
MLVNQGTLPLKAELLLVGDNYRPTRAEQSLDCRIANLRCFQIEMVLRERSQKTQIGSPTQVNIYNGK